MCSAAPSYATPPCKTSQEGTTVQTAGCEMCLKTLACYVRFVNLCDLSKQGFRLPGLSTFGSVLYIKSHQSSKGQHKYSNSIYKYYTYYSSGHLRTQDRSRFEKGHYRLQTLHSKPRILGCASFQPKAGANVGGLHGLRGHLRSPGKRNIHDTGGTSGTHTPQTTY